MNGSRKGLFVNHRGPSRGSWITLIALAILALTSTTSFSARARITSGIRTHTAWAAYRPYALSLGRDAETGSREETQTDPDLKHPPGWCSRTSTQGSAPWGSGDAVLVICLHKPRLPAALALERERSILNHKERSP
jgi:hypothetical protein